MEKVKVNEERCKGCHLCIANCKKGAISLSGRTNKRGIVTVTVDQALCVQCGVCYTMCPDLVFEIL